jgi:alcohol dehydrogenase class IV
MERIHTVNSPCKVIFGNEAARQVADQIRLLNGSRVLIISDEGVAQSGALEPISASLRNQSLSHVFFTEVLPDPPVRCIESALRVYREERCDLVVGAGGGSSLDVAKAVSILATNARPIRELCGNDRVKEKPAPKILIPTTAGTGSEVSPVLVFTDETENLKKGVTSSYVLPEVAIVDPLLTLSVPPQLTADTGIDALAHAIEAYVSTEANPFSDMYAEKSIELISAFLPVAWAKGSHKPARYAMSVAATLAGLAFGSAKVAAVHALSYSVAGVYRLSHGRAVGLMLPHVMRYSLSGNLAKFSRIATLMGKSVGGLSRATAAASSVEAVEELLLQVRLPCRLADCGYSDTDLPVLVSEGMKFSRLFAFNPRDLEEQDVQAIFQLSV